MYVSRTVDNSRMAEPILVNYCEGEAAGRLGVLACKACRWLPPSNKINLTYS